MPHQCTDCGRTFEDGSKEMLSGCPDCGGNKFQFQPDAVDEESAPPSEEPPEPPDPPVDSSVARTVGNAATAVRDLVGSDSQSDTRPDASAESTADPAVSDARESVAGSAAGEDSAQASARSEVIPMDELPPAPETATTTAGPTNPVPSGADEEPAETPDADPQERDRPGLDELREELNDQFESIRIVEPGQYELNLMELYDREEYIIALQEDGKYTIQVPERWEE